MRTLIIAAVVAPLWTPSSAAADPTEIEMPADPVKPTRMAAQEDEPPPGLSELPAAQAVATVAAPVKPRKWIEPYVAIAGGVMLESLHEPAEIKTSSQNPTVAVSLLGIRGGVGEHITYASSFEASIGGPLGYGASVWEGQAALAIWDQYVRYARNGFTIAVGRVEDPASFDYVSQHVGDLLFADLYTRDPLLYSGADRGNGLYAGYDLGAHVTAGLTFHSTNPTGITGTLIIGGKLQPFDRPFYLAAAAVGNSQNDLPDQNLHIYFGSPSVNVHFEHFEAKAEVQLYTLDTQESMTTDQPIRGYNFRLGARTWRDTMFGRVTAFANVSRNKNEILDPTDSLYRLPDLFKSYTISAGLDLDYAHKNGVGFQYALVDTNAPDQHERQHYFNLGTTYWIEDSFAVGVRAAVFADQISGEAMTTGSRSLFVTARLVLQ